MSIKLKQGETISYKMTMQTAAGAREFESSGEIVSLGDIQNGRIEVKGSDGNIRSIPANAVVGYDREPVVGPILFSAPMVLSVLARRKNQTRRLDTSPHRNRHAGDLIYVREAIRIPKFLDHVKPRNLSPLLDIKYEAGGPEVPPADTKLIPAIHMPRFFSRITLEVVKVSFEQIQDITAEDAIGEGILPLIRPKDELATLSGKPLAGNECSVFYKDYLNPDSQRGLEDPVESFKTLWQSLHNKPGETWEDNPRVVRVEFEAVFKNVDKL